MKENRWTLGFIALIGAVFLALDWSRLFIADASLTLSPYSVCLKIFLTFLTATIAWRAAGGGLSDHDEKQFRIIFSILFLADICFALGSLGMTPLGILLFAAMHVLLVRRNLTGFKQAKLSGKSWIAMVPALLAAAIIIPTVAWLDRTQGMTLLLAVIGIYFAVLWTSVAAAWSAVAIGKFPRANALQMAFGLSLFLLCDVTVALSLMLPGSRMRVVTESLAWMFHGPALCLIALSAWKAEPVRQQIALAGMPAGRLVIVRDPDPIEATARKPLGRLAS